MNVIRTVAATAALACTSQPSLASELSAIRNVVLVHGAFADGSGWSQVYRGLRKSGYSVTIVQNPLTSLADDVEATRIAIAQQAGDVILVGHSYGGVVISEVGRDAKVKGLVYIAAFAPDVGESVQSLITDPAPGRQAPPILPPQNGFLFLDRTKFAEAFAADVDPADAAFMADSQVPWGVRAFAGAVTTPAWKNKRSWYLVTTEDRMIPPEAQRQMAKRAGASVVEMKGSHAIYISQPQAVVKLIELAARSSE
ncbi:MAG TPA: alpha/beta hydrolase [Povalibacter sp.]